MSAERMEVRIKYSRLTAKLPLSQCPASFCVFPVASGLFHLLGLIFTQFWNFTRGRNAKEGTLSKTSNIVTVERHPQAVNPYYTWHKYTHRARCVWLKLTGQCDWNQHRVGLFCSIIRKSVFGYVNGSVVQHHLWQMQLDQEQQGGMLFQ